MTPEQTVIWLAYVEDEYNPTRWDRLMLSPHEVRAIRAGWDEDTARKARLRAAEAACDLSPEENERARLLVEGL